MNNTYNKIGKSWWWAAALGALAALMPASTTADANSGRVGGRRADPAQAKGSRCHPTAERQRRMVQKQIQGTKSAYLRALHVDVKLRLANRLQKLLRFNDKLPVSGRRWQSYWGLRCPKTGAATRRRGQASEKGARAPGRNRGQPKTPRR